MIIQNRSIGAPKSLYFIYHFESAIHLDVTLLYIVQYLEIMFSTEMDSK